MKKEYIEYLAEIEFEPIHLNDLTETMLHDLENKTGYVIGDEDDICICKKFESMDFLNQKVVMEKLYEFFVIDMIGSVMFEGSAEEVLLYAKGFLSDDEL